MAPCIMENLARLLAGKLDLDSKLEVLGHLEICPDCRDIYYRMSMRRDATFFVRRPYNVEKVIKGAA